MYGVIITVPAPVEIYDGMHAEMKQQTGTSIDGCLVHVGRTGGLELKTANWKGRVSLPPGSP